MPLANELFLMCECAQGKAFISNGINTMSDAEIFNLARRTIRIQDDLNDALRQWLREHSQPEE